MVLKNATLETELDKIKSGLKEQEEKYKEIQVTDFSFTYLHIISELCTPSCLLLTTIIIDNI